MANDIVEVSLLLSMCRIDLGNVKRQSCILRNRTISFLPMGIATSCLDLSILLRDMRASIITETFELSLLTVE